MTKRYNDDGDGKECWVDTAAACCCYDGGESTSPTNEQCRRRMTKKRGAGENTRNSTSCKDAELDCVLSTY